MTVDLEPSAVATASGEKCSNSPSSPRKDVMVDPAASVSAATAATVSNTACTSPLTVTSLEAAAAAGALSAKYSNEQGVPGVVGQVVPVKPTPHAAVPVEAMAKLGLGSGMGPGRGGGHPNQVIPGQSITVVPRGAGPPKGEKQDHRHHHLRSLHHGHHGAKSYHRTPPTEHDDRKLFVGGLPTDVTDDEFLDYFQKFGEVIDSVVMTDRLTRRSRGFGFVTFASEKDALSLLTAIPGKTGYVLLGGKQCEVKASTPKNESDGPKHHHHGAPGMWRSNPPRHTQHGGYMHHQGQMKSGFQGQMQHPQAAVQKHFYIDNEFNGDFDGRNFDELYAGQAPAYSGYNQAGPTYNQGYQNYQYPSGYVYASGPGGESVPDSYEASYPAQPSQGYAPQYNPYAAQQFPNQYATQYGNGGAPVAMGTMGYANYQNGYYAEDGASVPSQGLDASEGGGWNGGGLHPEAIPQAYQGDGGYGPVGNAGQYE